MYSYEDRIRAVKFYITCGYNAAYTVSKLGYPDASNLKHWYKEYSESNDLHKGRKKVSKFSDREKRDAVDYYFAHDRNALQTVKALGYPSRPLLIQWVKELCPEEGKRRCKSFKSHVRCSQEEKIQAVMESCKGNLKIAQIAEIYGVTPSAVSIWRKELLGEGKTLKMIQPPAEDKSIEQLIREKAELEAKVKRLENDVYKLQLERDILEKAGDILKKEEGINLDQLTNREKVFLIDALRNKYKLNELLPVLKLSKSSYCYQVQCIKSKDKYKELRQQIKELFMCNKEIYGYRRIHCLLRKDGIIVSEKIVRRIMNEEQLIVKAARKRKYNSYKGEITPEVDNIIKRDFSAKKPNEKWLTDITEFHIPAGKIYLSPIIDCFDGMVVSWTIGTSPNSKLANTMLQKAIEQLDPSEHPLVHSDRGCHYRWPEWINLMDTAGLTRSMSKWKQSEKARAEAELGRSQAELKNLKNQINPHFLLNTLNNIYALTGFDQEKAQWAIHELSRLLRYMLYENQTERVSLNKEVEFLQSYISLMRLRLLDNVDVKVVFDYPKEENLQIAPLIFISLVENAFKHGISSGQHNFIHITLKSDAHHLCFCCENSNTPQRESDKSPGGIGLQQVASRLEYSYPNRYTWRVELADGGSTYRSVIDIYDKPIKH